MLALAPTRSARSLRAVPACPKVSARALRSVPAAVSCSNCSLRGVCLPSGLAAGELGELSLLTSTKRRIVRGAALYRGHDPLQALYAVHGGAFKSVGISRAGEEKVTGFHLPGEVMGLDAINNQQHSYDAVALEDSEVCVIPYASLTELASHMPSLQCGLFRMLSGDISRDQGLMLLLGSMTAEQRIAAFLLSMSRRHQKLGYAPNRFHLRMTREDIGSYLGLTLETVSRLLSRFHREGLIAAQQRDIELKDVAAIKEIVGHW